MTLVTPYFGHALAVVVQQSATSVEGEARCSGLPDAVADYSTAIRMLTENISVHAPTIYSLFGEKRGVDFVP
jgi:hypothetical protein